MASPKQYWLMKSEPSVYSIDDLLRDQKTCWEGVRNFQARNMLRDEMHVGDEVLFYHSSAEPPGVAGIARIIKSGYPDAKAWDKKSKYYDVKSTPERPLWFMVDIGFVEKFPNVVPLEKLRSVSTLESMLVLKRGMRLSVQPVLKKHFDVIVKMGRGSA